MARPLPALLAVLLAIACTPSEERPPALPGPGPGTGGGTEGGGAPPDGGTDAPGAARIEGSLCIIVDLRSPLACTAGQVEGLDVVARGGGADEAGVTGAFSLASPGGDSAILEAAFDDPGFRDTLIRVRLLDGAATDAVVPVIPTVELNRLLAELEILEPDGAGTLVVYVRDDQSPVLGAEIIQPAGAFAPFYDTGDPVGWDQLGLTGAAGAAVIFGVPADGQASYTVIEPDGDSLDVIGVPVEEGAITFDFVELTEDGGDGDEL